MSHISPLDGLRLERLELLLSVAQDLTSILDLDKLLGRAGHLLQGFAPHDHFAIFLYDREHEELIWKVGIGYTEESRRRLERFPVSRGLVGKAIRTRAAFLSQDVSQDPDFLPAQSEKGEVLRSALAIPLIHQDEVVGAMALEGTRVGQFTDEQQRVLSALGSILAIAIVNARLYEASLRDAATKDLLYQVSRETSSILDLYPLLDKVADMIKRVMDYQLFAIYLLDPASGDLILKNTRGWSVESIRRYRQVPEDSGLFWRAIRERRSFTVDDTAKEPGYLLKETYDGHRLASQINVPLVAKDKPVGVMTLESQRPGGFDEEHQRILDTLASQIAIAIDNARLYEELRSREQKLENDLQLARALQRSMLPDEPPTIPGFELGTAYLPADNLGGDFYDFIRVSSYRTGIVIADVSGKGVGAAMTMAAARGSVRSAAENHEEPAGLLHAANRRLFRDIKRNVFVTLCYGLLDPTRGTLTYSSAGHNPPLLIRENGEVVHLEAGGTVMGMFDGVTFEQETLKLGSGDVVCFYTDGVVEAFNRDEDVYGEKRLEQLLQMTRRLPAAEVARLVVQSVEEFARARPQHDDMTVIVLKSR